MALDLTGQTLGALLASAMEAAFPSAPPYDNSDGYISPSQMASISANQAAVSPMQLLYWNTLSKTIIDYLVSNTVVNTNDVINKVTTLKDGYGSSCSGFADGYGIGTIK